MGKVTQGKCMWKLSGGLRRHSGWWWRHRSRRIYRKEKEGEDMQITSLGRIQCEFNKTWAGLESKPGKYTQWGREWLSRVLNRGEKEENIPKELEWE